MPTNYPDLIRKTSLAEWDQARRNENHQPIKISNQVFSNLKHQNSSFKDVEFDTCTLKNVEISMSDLSGLKFYNCKIEQLKLTNCKANNLVFELCQTERVLLKNVSDGNYINGIEIIGGSHNIFDFPTLKIRNFKASNTEIEELLPTPYPINEASFRNVTFKASHIVFGNNQSYTNCHFKEGCRFRQTMKFNEFADCRFYDAILNDVSFEGSTFQDCHMANVSVNKKTRFDNCVMDNVTFKKYNISLLSNDSGGLQKCDMLTMTFVDDLMALQRSFSGFLQWIHGIALMVFLAPYLMFFLKYGFMASHENDGPALWEHFWHYFVSGGKFNGQTDCITISISLVSIMYNIIRFILLFKTKTMEHEMSIRELPIEFSFYTQAKLNVYGWLYQINKYGFYFMMVLYVIHTLFYFSLRLPNNI